MEAKCKGSLQPIDSPSSTNPEHVKAEVRDVDGSDATAKVKKQDMQRKRGRGSDDGCPDQQGGAKASARPRRSSSPSCTSSTASCSDEDEKESKAHARPAKPSGGGKYILPPPVYERDRFLATDPADVMEKLVRYGMVVVPSVLDETKCQAAFDGLMEALEGVFPDFKRDEPSTWRALRDNGAKHAMLLQTHGLGWCQAAVDIRQVLLARV
jgi:hypothetical protein